MLISEDAEILRRRGRWLSSRIMEIYVQEITSLRFLPAQSERTKLCIYTAMQCFHDILNEATFLIKIKVPVQHWYVLFASGTRA